MSDFFAHFLPYLPTPVRFCPNIYFQFYHVVSHFGKSTYLPKNRTTFIDVPNEKLSIYLTQTTKERSYYSKIIFLALNNGAFYWTLSSFTLYDCTKFCKTGLFLGNFLGAATIQERPSMVRVMYSEHFSNLKILQFT